MTESMNNFLDPEYPADAEPLGIIEGEISGENVDVDVSSSLSNIALSQTVEINPKQDNDEIWVEKAVGIVYSTDPVKDYLRIIGRVPLLNAEDEVVLAKAIEVGLFARSRHDVLVQDPTTPGTELRELRELEATGTKAKERMVSANLRLVVNLAKRYTGKGLSFLDIIQEGNLGLMRAVEKFDYEKGFKFSTYATWWIRQSIHRGIADTSRERRIPAHLNEIINNVFERKRQLLTELGREPTDEEIAADSNITVDKLHDYVGYIRDPVSMNMKIGDEQINEFGDLLPDTTVQQPEDALDKARFIQRMHTLLDELDEEDASVLRKRMGIDMAKIVTLQELGNELGLSIAQVKQVQMRILAKIRKNPELMQELREYL